MAREKWPPPTGIDAEAKSEWRSMRNILKGRGDLTSEDDSVLATLERYVRFDQLARDCRKQRNGRLTAMGSTGQTVAHPLIAVERGAEEDAAKALKAMLLTPESRKAKADGDEPNRQGGGKIPRGRFG